MCKYDFLFLRHGEASKRERAPFAKLIIPGHDCKFIRSLHVIHYPLCIHTYASSVPRAQNLYTTLIAHIHHRRAACVHVAAVDVYQQSSRCFSSCQTTTGWVMWHDFRKFKSVCHLTSSICGFNLQRNLLQIVLTTHHLIFSPAGSKFTIMDFRIWIIFFYSKWVDSTGQSWVEVISESHKESLTLRFLMQNKIVTINKSNLSILFVLYNYFNCCCLTLVKQDFWEKITNYHCWLVKCDAHRILSTRFVHFWNWECKLSGSPTA